MNRKNRPLPKKGAEIRLKSVNTDGFIYADWRLVTRVYRRVSSNKPGFNVNARAIYLGGDSNRPHFREIGAEDKICISTEDWNDGSWDYIDDFAGWVQETRKCHKWRKLMK